MLAAIRPREPQVDRPGLWAENAGKHLPSRHGFVLPVSRGPNDHRVDAEGHVVDEHPIGDQPEIDPYLLRIAEGVESTYGVARIETEVLGEVVAGPNRHAHERQIVRQGDLGHQGLRPVATRHAKDVRSALHSSLGTTLEIVAGAEDDILDPSSVGLVGQGNPLGGPAA